MIKKQKIWLYNHLHLLNGFKKNKAQTQFLVLSESRSGSTLLKTILNQNENIHCDGELFNKALHGKSLFPLFHISAYRNKRSEYIYGFKLFHYQLSNQYGLKKSKSIIDQLYKKDFKIIYLTRQNIIDQVLSVNLAGQKKQYHSNDMVKQEKAYVNPTSFITQLNRRVRFRKEEQEILSNKNYLHLCYENDLINNEKQKDCVMKVSQFLNITPSDFEVKLKKLNQKKTLKDQIDNYEAFKDAILKTEHKKYLY